MGDELRKTLAESEALICAAAQVAREESATRSPDEKIVVIHIKVKGVGEWYLDSTGDLEKIEDGAFDERAENSASLHLTYSSDDVFVALAYGRIDARAAVLTGKISFRGDIDLATRLKDWMQTVVVQREAGGGELELASRSSWERDEDARECNVCRQPFKVYRRRHHCRFCGKVVCDKCSRFRVRAERACGPCRDRADAMRAARPLPRQETEQSEETTRTVGGEELDVLQSRVLELEEQLETFDRRSYAVRSALLRRVVMLFYRTLVLSVLGLLLLAAHLTASQTSTMVGPYLSEMTVPVPPVSSLPPLTLFCDGDGKVAGHATPAGVVGPVVPGEENAYSFVPSEQDVEAAPSDNETNGEQGGDKAASRSDIMGEGGVCAEGGSCPKMGCERNGTCASPVEESEDQPSGRALERARRVTVSLYWVLMTLAVALLWWYQRRTEGLLIRRLKTFCLSGTAIAALKLTRIQSKGLSRKESNEAWDDIHKLLAPYVYESIVSVSGMWIKIGQYLSSRADVMPQPYLNELSKLQDAVPASPYSEVEETVREEFGRLPSELFAWIDENPLASASVAQVHRCTLKDGREAVVKVQHQKVRRLFLEDLGNLTRLVNFVAWADSEFDFRPIMNEWTAECTKELDFFREAENLNRVGAAMNRSGLDIIIPELVPEFTRTKVVVMTFCRGFKVTDAKALESANLDRVAIMQAVTRSFAYQIHMDGMFNGDPHPGNILIQLSEADGGANGEQGGGEGKKAVRHATPVLLDWGLAKTLPEHLRVAFSRFVHSACEHDFVAMLMSFDEMGMKLNRFDPAEDMYGIRFILRDTAPAEEAKKQSKKFLRRIKRRRDHGLKNPVDAYPGDLLFFLRVLELLRGLATRLNVRQQYMELMAPYARQALYETVPKAERATEIIYPSPLLSPLEGKVREMVSTLVEGGQITGCQVCVIYRGRRLVDLSAGTQGPVDPRPVTPSTVFCVFSAGKAVCSTAIHMLVDRGLLRYDQKVAELWPAFGCQGKEKTTVRHILTHSTGLQHAFPEKATLSSVCDWAKIQEVLEEAQPVWAPGTRSSYHYFTFGWLVAAVVERVSGVPFEEFIRREMASPLNVEDEFYMGKLGAHAVDEKRIASVEYSFKPRGFPSEGGAGKKDGEDSAPREQDGEDDEEEIVGVGDVEIASAKEKGSGGGGRKAEVGGILGMMARALKETDPEEGAELEDLARKLRGREYFLDPRIFNHHELRDACIPAANGFFTAKALALLYDNFLESLGLSDGRTRRAHRSSVKPKKAEEHVPNGDASSSVDASARTSSGGVEGGGTQPRVKRNGPLDARPLLSRSRVNEMRTYQVNEKSALHVMFGLPGREIRYALGYQMFGFREEVPKPAANVQPVSASASTARRRGKGPATTVPAGTAATASTRGRIRLSGFGQVGMGGAVGLCDPASGLVFAMTSNKVNDGRKTSSTVLRLVCDELKVGDPSHFFAD